MSHGGLGIEHLVDVEPIGLDPADGRLAATDVKLERRVAVRVLPPIASEGERGRFLDRARVLAGLSGHPNIVTVYDVGTTGDGRPYVVTELIDGPDLTTLVESGGALPWSDATELALQLAAGLDQIHRAGARHRDLRPENVLLSGSSAVLTDVGLLPTVGRTPETSATLAHRAPEALDGDGDERSDLYSLTSLLYLMIDGRAPYWRPADTVEALRARRLNQTAPPLEPDLVPPALAVFVAAGLSADPLDRPQYVAEFVGELRRIIEGRATGSTPSVLHATSGSLPIIPPAATALPAASVVRVTTPDGAIDETTVQPSSVFDTAESTALDGRTLVPAGPWAPPGQAQGAGYRSEPTTSAVHRSAVDTIQDVEIPVPAFAPPPFTPDPGPPPVDDADLGSAPPDGGTTLIPTFDADPGPMAGPASRPLLVVAGAMITIGLIALMAIVTVGLGGSDTDGEAAAPVLPDLDAPTEAGTGEPADASATTLTPLAMLPESTTTTESDEMVTSTNTTVRRVVVPNLVGLDVAAAGQQLSDAGFGVLVVGRVSPGSIPGTVIQQTPANGATIELPATVTLFIPRSSTLPSMVGRPADTVCLQLTALGLRCEQTLRFDDRVAPGAVIATEPTEGSAFTDGQTIRIDVSRGPLTEARIPPVTGQTEDEARTTLGGAGFVAVTTVSQPSDDVPVGRAIGTDPVAGTSLTIDRPVVIQVSSGPAPMVTVPELVGLDRGAAEAALQRAQLVGSFVSTDLPAGDPNIGRVVAVDPAEATGVAAGSTVTITIGQAAAGSSTTTTAPAMTTSTTADNGG